MSDWEARMSQRAHDRFGWPWSATADQSDSAIRARLKAEHAAEMNRLAHDMTLADAVQLWNHPPVLLCACTGPPNCCMDRARTAARIIVTAARLVELIQQRMSP